MRTYSKPERYLYLDQEGIRSLYAQTVERFEVERSVSVEKTIAGKAGVSVRLKNLLTKALLGIDGDASGEVSGSRKSSEQVKQVSRIENELASLLKVLQHTGTPVFFPDLRPAVLHIGDSTQSVFVMLEDRFEAPQFRDGSSGKSVTDEGFLILQKGLGDDYDHSDEYYRKISVPLVLHASTDKMPPGSFRLSGHLAVWFRGHRGEKVPMKVFGSMTYTPAYYYVKPYAIWL